MYAIIETGGKQYRVTPGEILNVEKIDAQVGSEHEFDKVLLVANGDDIQIGSPVVEGAKVTAEVIEHGKAKKVMVFKKKRRKGYKVKRGHRQQYTTITIKAISA